jgi:hypothetical protein
MDLDALIRAHDIKFEGYGPSDSNSAALFDQFLGPRRDPQQKDGELTQKATASRSQAKRASHPHRVKYWTSCRRCGTVFPVKHRFGKFCSTKCQKLAWQTKMRANARLRIATAADL